MILTNLNEVNGRTFEILGVVDGSSVYSKHFGKDLMAGFKNMVGGELSALTEMLDDGKEQAMNRMIDKAEGLNADAILGIDYSITNMQTGSAIVVSVIGTAVKFI